MRAKRMLLNAVPLSILVVLIASPPVARAQTDAKSSAHHFRYEILTKSGDFKYTDEIQVSSATMGTYYKIQTDDHGRIAEVDETRDGKSATTRKLHYTGDEKFASSYEETGNMQGRGGTFHVKRAPSGDRIRSDRFNAKNALASYTTYEDKGDHVEELTFNTADKQTNHRDYYFSPAGNCVRQITYFADARLDSDVDEATGLAITSKQIDAESGQTATQKFTYSPDGDVLRIDVFNSSGERFATQEYEGDLVTRRFYNYSDGTSKELRYTYNDKKWLVAAKIYYNGKYVCSLSYDRLADGSIKRTLALGPDGELWAEYPAPEVVDIQDDGQPINRSDGVIHKEGIWWGISATRVN